MRGRIREGRCSVVPFLLLLDLLSWKSRIHKVDSEEKRNYGNGTESYALSHDLEVISLRHDGH